MRGRVEGVFGRKSRAFSWRIYVYMYVSQHVNSSEAGWKLSSSDNAKDCRVTQRANNVTFTFTNVTLSTVPSTNPTLKLPLRVVEIEFIGTK